jgi:ATP-dependent Lon protease
MLTDRCVGPNLAMTGEITLTGQVLPVGGIKEKVLAAKRSGVRELILPFENEVNVREDLKSEQIGDVKIHYVKLMEEVVELALEKKRRKAGAAKKP